MRGEGCNWVLRLTRSIFGVGIYVQSKWGEVKNYVDKRLRDNIDEDESK